MFRYLRHLVIRLIIEHGYLGLTSLLMLGIVGLPVPDETLLLYCGYLVHVGQLSLLPTIAAAVLGAGIGITVSYLIGRTLGHQALIRYGRYLHITEERLATASDWWRRHGRWSLTFGYYIPAFRHLVALVGGAAEIGFYEFALFAYPGAVMWCCTFIFLGLVFGRQWRWLGREIHHHLLIAAAIIAAALIVYFFVRSRLAKKAESAPTRS